MRKNLYYGFWLPAIKYQVEKNGESSGGWQLSLLFLISHTLGLGLAGLTLWLKYFKIITDTEDIRTPTYGYNLSGIVSFFLTYTLVFYILNYFLILYKKRYLRLLNKYEPLSKWKVVIIFILVAVSPFISIEVIYLISK